MSEEYGFETFQFKISKNLKWVHNFDQKSRTKTQLEGPMIR